MLKALRGTKDILPEESGIWQHIEASARDIFAIYGYKEIRTPIIEEASLFVRSIGEVSDIVKKEMYVFSDRGGRNIALRPEGTASVVRAYIENSLGYREGLSKLFYIGPMFRSERPQKGRQRQFHQLGVEAIGSDNPFLDVEVLLLAVNFLRALGILDFNLRINSLGCDKDKLTMIEGYRNALGPHLGSLCDECNERYGKNVLRIFDCKNPECRERLKYIKLKNPLCPACSEHLEFIKKGLMQMGIDYTIDRRIVRGLDYYTKTVFEITQKDLGAKDTICAGGRYNNLVRDMGGKDTPAIGFAFGVERLILSVVKDFCPGTSTQMIFIATAEKVLCREAFKLLEALRCKGFSCGMDYEGRSLRAQMKRSERMKADFVVIFGGEEYAKGKIVLRDMKKRKQREIGLDRVAEELAEARALNERAG